MRSENRLRTSGYGFLPYERQKEFQEALHRHKIAYRLAGKGADQEIDKITELENDLRLNDLDSFIFLISSNMLNKEALKKERAYSSKWAPDYPDKDKRLIGEMYV